MLLRVHVMGFLCWRVANLPLLGVAPEDRPKASFLEFLLRMVPDVELWGVGVLRASFCSGCSGLCATQPTAGLCAAQCARVQVCPNLP
jgi:hypothetical protein